VSLCKGMDKEPALRRARATLRVARRWAPLPKVTGPVWQRCYSIRRSFECAPPCASPATGRPYHGQRFLMGCIVL